MDIHDLIMNVNDYIMAIHNCCEFSIIELRDVRNCIKYNWNMDIHNYIQLQLHMAIHN